MRLATIKLNNAEVAGIVTAKGILPIAKLNEAKGTTWKTEMMELIQAQEIPQLTEWYNAGGKEELETMPGLVPAEEVETSLAILKDNGIDAYVIGEIIANDAEKVIL